MSDPANLPRAANAGFADASSYDKYRPTYPPEAVEALLKALKVSGQKGLKILDLAAGTGKFTEGLAKRDEGYDIIAIEPHTGMRGELERKNLPNVRTLNAKADRMPLDSQSVDAVICAQSFHWFSTPEAIQEIHRVLRPGGSLGMIWNIDNYNSPQWWPLSTSWERKVREMIWTFEDEIPRYRQEKWRKVFDDQLKTNPLSIQAADPLFSLPLGEESFHFTRWFSKQAIWERLSTISQVAILETEETERVKKFVFEALDGDDLEANANGDIALQGQTVLAWTSAIPSAPMC